MSSHTRIRMKPVNDLLEQVLGPNCGHQLIKTLNNFNKSTPEHFRWKQCSSAKREYELELGKNLLDDKIKRIAPLKLKLDLSQQPFRIEHSCEIPESISEKSIENEIYETINHSINNLLSITMANQLKENMTSLYQTNNASNHMELDVSFNEEYLSLETKVRNLC